MVLACIPEICTAVLTDTCSSVIPWPPITYIEWFIYIGFYCVNICEYSKEQLKPSALWSVGRMPTTTNSEGDLRSPEEFDQIIHMEYSLYMVIQR